MDREIGNPRRYPYAVLALLCGTLALPSAGWAASGASGLAPGAASVGSATAGSSATSGSSATAGSPATSATSATAGTAGTSSTVNVQNGDMTVSASGAGITLQTEASAMLSSGLSFTGAASPSAAGETIEIERSGHETGWQWAPTVAATVAPNGSFSAIWPTDHIGRFAIRAVVTPPAGPLTNASLAEQASATATPALTVTVYRPSLATQYGPGFYGRRTACGETLTKSIIGVANRTLECGTLVAVYYEGRTLVVPVIDRGPYANGADWDLTEATGRALGISGTAEVGAVSLPQP
jgi:hypothetical protein